MIMFYGMVMLFWLPLMLWWFIAPNYFPFLKEKKWGRFKIFFANITAYLVIMASVSLILGGKEPSDFGSFIGMLLGFAVIYWVVRRSIQAGRLAKKQSAPKPTKDARKPRKVKADPIPATPVVNQPQSQPATFPPEIQKQTTTSKPQTADSPPKLIKPVAKQDIELGDTDYLEMTYQGSDGKISTRAVLVKNLKKSKDGNWYASCVDVEVREVKSFRVDRIISLSHNDQTWTDYNDILGVVRTFETLV